ncbi:unnamed protein product, partial [Brassica oleracea]
RSIEAPSGGSPHNICVHSNRQFFVKCLIVGTVHLRKRRRRSLRLRHPCSPTKLRPEKTWSRPKEGLILTRTQGSLSKDVGSVPHQICSPWSEWTETFALNTLTYREYANKGAGAETARRVRWRGFKVITAASEAQRYTAGQFIGGGGWLGSTGFPFSLGL